MVAAIDPALQHGAPAAGVGAALPASPPTPRPLPLFLDMVRDVAAGDPALARRALEGVRLYGVAPRPPRPPLATAHAAGRARLLRPAGDGALPGRGAPVVLVPSLINPAAVLDLDERRSLLRYLAARGHRAMLLDWGVPAADEAGLDIAGHVERYLLPLLAAVGEPAHLVGYCLGGTMAIAAASLAPVRSLTLLATPWHYGRYPRDAAARLGGMWRTMQPSVAALGAMPMEMLQPAFWSRDPQGAVRKYAALAGRAADDPRIADFARLEDWANGGAPLTAAVAADLFDRFISADDPGHGAWRVGGRPIDPASLACPARHIVARADRIAPAETAPDPIPVTAAPSGHVGMIVGSGALESCWRPVADWLAVH